MTGEGIPPGQLGCVIPAPIPTGPLPHRIQAASGIGSDWSHSNREGQGLRNFAALLDDQEPLTRGIQYGGSVAWQGEQLGREAVLTWAAALSPHRECRTAGQIENRDTSVLDIENDDPAVLELADRAKLGSRFAKTRQGLAQIPENWGLHGSDRTQEPRGQHPCD